MTLTRLNQRRARVSTNTSHSAGEGLCNGLVTTDQDHDPPTTRHLFSDQAGGAGTSTIILAVEPVLLPASPCSYPRPRCRWSQASES
jgi:hypothetical protein